MQINTSAIGAITPYSKHSFLVKFSFMRSFAIMSKNSFIIFLFKICMIQIPVLHYSKFDFALFKSPVIICRTSSCVQFALIASWRMNLAKSSLISFSDIVMARNLLMPPQTFCMTYKFCHLFESVYKSFQTHTHSF